VATVSWGGSRIGGTEEAPWRFKIVPAGLTTILRFSLLFFLTMRKFQNPIHTDASKINA
jgi:hypothetical protein